MHPQLWLPFAGAIIGAPLIAFLTWRLLKHWLRFARPLRWFLLIALALFETAYWLAIYAWFVEPNLLVVHRETIVSEQWRGPPLTIAAVGDMHVRSPHMDARRVGRVVQRINALNPDLVVLLGDYAGSHEPASMRSQREQSEILNGVATFAALDARYGAVAVLGNHDSWYDRAAIAEALERAGVAALWNRHVVIARSSGRFVVAGLADSDTGDPDYARAIDGAPADAPVIGLTHSPDPFAEMPDSVSLTLAGHTHCGQVTLPFVGRLIVPSAYRQKYACHLVKERGRKMFVTSGIGTSILPVRFLNPPEIALITLRGSRQSAIGSREGGQ